MKKEAIHNIVILLILFVAIGTIFMYSDFKFTGLVVLEGYENQADCEGAGYTWEILTEENCTDIPDCVESCVESCVEDGEVCEEECVESCEECSVDCLACEEGNQTCEDENCVEGCESCVVEVEICEEGCVLEEDLCAEDCQVTCENCTEIVIGGQCIGDVCDAEHLTLCLNETECVGGGGYWYDEVCNAEEECVFDTCGSNCGDISDGCGGILNCGQCESDDDNNDDNDDEEEVVCGDGDCHATESCSSCEEDCGECPTITGEVTETICTPDWQCEEWNECVDNIQTRICNNTNNCSIEDGKPVVSQSCELPETCFDEIKNQDETGIDCGGVCEKRCSFFTIAGNVIRGPIETGKEFFLENKIRGFIILGVVVLGAGGFITFKILKKKKILLWKKLRI